MALDDISNKELQLGLGLVLGLHDQPENGQRKKDEVPSKYNSKGYPCLTLGPPYDEANNDEPATKTESVEYFNPQASSSPSALLSSFSNSSSIKRERDQFVSEEFEPEVEKVPSIVVGDVDEDGSTRKKLRLTKEQSAVLEDSFKGHSTLNPKQKQELAGKLNLRPRQVEVWFQNRRARTKLKQTESECELLKKCCETLTEENKRLQKELQELISIMKTTPAGAAPFYMQLPLPAAATLTICPSCERICNGSSPTTSVLIASNSKPNHHLHKNNYPLTHSSSAAC